MSNKEVNKRTLESFIKSGALDTLPGTRKQKLIVSGDLLESKSKEKKDGHGRQMSFFDIAPEEEKDNFHITSRMWASMTSRHFWHSRRRPSASMSAVIRWRNTGNSGRKM